MVAYSFQPQFEMAIRTGRKSQTVRAIGKRRHGFADWTALTDFWAKHHPGIIVFDGLLITWRDFKPSDGATA